jgi:hypothetical protein
LPFVLAVRAILDGRHAQRQDTHAAFCLKLLTN